MLNANSFSVLPIVVHITSKGENLANSDNMKRKFCNTTDPSS